MLASQLKYTILVFAWTIMIKLIMNPTPRLPKFPLLKSSCHFWDCKSSEWSLPVWDEIIDEYLAAHKSNATQMFCFLLVT